jgi:serine protease inhibitor
MRADLSRGPGARAASPMPTRVALAWTLLGLLLGSCTATPAASTQPTTGSVVPSPSSGPVVTAKPSGSPPEIVLASSSVKRLPASRADARSAASALNAFGFDLYQRVAPVGDNAVMSPASIAIALGMARVGARGATATEMDRVLHDIASESHANWLNGLESQLAARSGTFNDAANKPQNIRLHLANSQFAQSGMHLERAFLDALASRYGAGVRLVDYARDPDAARRLINAWVSDQTEERIPELLSPANVTEYTRLTLVNAVYLKAPWLIPFDQPSDEAFTRLDGSRVTVPLMHLSSGPLTFRAARTSEWQAVELPYVGRELAMLVIVPRDYRAYTRSLDVRALGDVDAALRVRAVDFTMPKFKIETRAELSDVLSAMGMRRAFGEGADFSGITGDRALQIGFVVHQANIDVDENGTEAAAATAVGFDTSGGGPEPVVIRADKPFLFALRDVPTGAILFLGSVTDPSK